MFTGEAFHGLFMGSSFRALKSEDVADRHELHPHVDLCKGV